jgi:hypothetical protein
MEIQEEVTEEDTLAEAEAVVQAAVEDQLQVNKAVMEVLVEKIQF